MFITAFFTLGDKFVKTFLSVLKNKESKYNNLKK